MVRGFILSQGTNLELCKEILEEESERYGTQDTGRSIPCFFLAQDHHGGCMELILLWKEGHFI